MGFVWFSQGPTRIVSEGHYFEWYERERRWILVKARCLSHLEHEADRTSFEAQRPKPGSAVIDWGESVLDRS